MEYVCYTKLEIDKLYDLGVSARKAGKEFDNFMNDMVLNGKLSLWELDNHAECFIKMGYDGEEKPTEKTYYRIGEPAIDYCGNRYRNSNNFAENKPECGISVVTEKWLNSFKSVFFGAHDTEVLKNRGVYEITGYVISHGGDDEITIYPTKWAKKTGIRSVSGLKKAVKKAENE